MVQKKKSCLILFRVIRWRAAACIPTATLGLLILPASNVPILLGNCLGYERLNSGGVQVDIPELAKHQHADRNYHLDFKIQ